MAPGFLCVYSAIHPRNQSNWIIAFGRADDRSAPQLDQLHRKFFTLHNHRYHDGILATVKHRSRGGQNPDPVVRVGGKNLDSSVILELSIGHFAGIRNQQKNGPPPKGRYLMSVYSAPPGRPALKSSGFMINNIYTTGHPKKQCQAV
jgi:hypothetical protein